MVGQYLYLEFEQELVQGRRGRERIRDSGTGKLVAWHELQAPSLGGRNGWHGRLTGDKAGEVGMGEAGCARQMGFTFCLECKEQLLEKSL